MEIFITLLVIILAGWTTITAVGNLRKEGKTNTERFMHVLQIIVGTYNAVTKTISLKNLVSARFA